MLVSVWGLEADVNNGGFDQYYSNGYSDFAAEVVGYLERMGALRAAAIVREANSVFGPAGAPADRDDRQEVADVIREQASEVWERLDQEFFAYPDDIQGLLEKYVGDGDCQV